MKTKNSPEPPFVPSARPPEIEAMRNQLRAHLPEYVDEDIIFDDPGDVPAVCSLIQQIQIVRVDEDGSRKIVAPGGAEYDYLEDDGDDDDEQEDDDFDDEDDEVDDTPENNEPAGYEYDTSGAFTIRSGAEWYAQNDDLLPEGQLFGDLWVQNDLCIMFADTNAGKSILAVQIADSISRGVPVPGFACTAEPAPVLYFDFELSDHQFRSRYSGAGTGKYPFTDGFYRATLNAYSPKQHRFATFEEFISNEIENALICCKAKTLIIDNISCLRYGTHNTAGALNLMQYLQGIKRTYQISILVLAHTPKRNPAKPISRNDLQGSKMLINLADSAFAIGESRQQPGLKYLKQVKQRGAAETHGADNVCLGRITRTGSFMHFTFAGCGHESDHLAPQTEQYRCATGQRISQLHGQGHSVRKIAAQLGLAPTTIFRALKRLEKCGKEDEGADEETQCADMPMCECADEEVTIAEPASENQYLSIQLKALSRMCHTEAQACPEATRREVRPKPVSLYEPQSHDAQNALSRMCHTEGQACPEATRREVRPKPVPPYEAQTHDDPNAKMCHTEGQACPEATRREVRPKPVPPYEPQSHDDQKAPAPALGSPLERGMEGFSKPVPSYEAQTHDTSNAKAPAPCHSLPKGGGREGFGQPVTPYEAQTHDDPNALPQTCHTEVLGVHPTSIIEIIPSPQKQPKPQTGTSPKITPYEPGGGFLTIDDEIEGLNYIEKYAPMLFTAAYKSRLQLLKKIKGKGI